jgi:hypothetical protein
MMGQELHATIPSHSGWRRPCGTRSNTKALKSGYFQSSRTVRRLQLPCGITRRMSVATVPIPISPGRARGSTNLSRRLAAKTRRATQGIAQAADLLTASLANRQINTATVMVIPGVPLHHQREKATLAEERRARAAHCRQLSGRSREPRSDEAVDRVLRV